MPRILDNAMFCASCGQAVPAGTGLCARCGAGPASPPLAGQKNWAPPPNATPYAASEWAHTPTPGAPMDKPTLITPPPQTSSLPRLISIILLVLVAIAVVAKIFFLSLFFHSESPAPQRGATAAVTSPLRC